MKQDLTNKFFDINKLPTETGLLVFFVSPSKISNVQKAGKYYDYIEHITIERKAITKPHVGLNFIYGDSLYFHDDESAAKLRNKILPLINSHKHNFLNLLRKNPWYIEKAFTFMSWSQLLLESKDFFNYFGELKKIYESDKNFQSHLTEDNLASGNRGLTNNQINFFLEECLLFYLISKGKIRLPNEFTQGNEKWILTCYPGKPLRSEIYLFQQNFFELDYPMNVYQNSYYDLEEKKLYDFERVDLETIKL